jgi:predicted site-specific integrase-resolvase
MGGNMIDKEYLTLAEVAEYVGVKRPSLYYYINALKIKTHKFNLDKRAYILRADAERIKEIKEKPWLAGEKQSSEDAA